MIYSKVTLKDLTPIILDLSKCLFSFFSLLFATESELWRPVNNRQCCSLVTQ